MTWKDTLTSSTGDWAKILNRETFEEEYVNTKTGERHAIKPDYGGVSAPPPPPVVDPYKKLVPEIESSRKWGSPSAHEYVTLNAKQEDLDIANKRIADLEHKMKHMEETFTKTVQDLVEALTKEDNGATTNPPRSDDIPF